MTFGFFIFIDVAFTHIIKNMEKKADSPRKQRHPRPDWLKVRLPGGESYNRLKSLVREQNLHTVCQDARCPNIGECWGKGTATFMILGEVCTRSCRFCAVKTGMPPEYDRDEPGRIASAIKKMGLRYAVITSVDRDDLADGGARVFSETIHRTRTACPDIRIEVLIPDFQGNSESLRTVVDAQPDVVAHNVETVPRLYRSVRPGSRYRRSLDVLVEAKRMKSRLITKSSLMLGLGESREEILEVLDDLRNAGVDIVTLGQYLQPTRDNLSVERFYTPEEFEEYRDYAYQIGFRSAASGPLVRSSYHAEEGFPLNVRTY
ncbi:MAG: lipoyl synthase [Acidobacteria bacterium]|nr:lipoyl synthase [Acidobacteriota bacterium]